MKPVLLFEGKTTMGGKDVKLKIYRMDDEEGKTCYYEWDYDPHLVDESQVDVHLGEINKGRTLEEILMHINTYKQEIQRIKEIRPNAAFYR